SNIDLNSGGRVKGFKSTIQSLKKRDGTETNLIFKSKDSYGRFSGVAVVFIFQDQWGNTIVRDFAGTLNQMIQEANSIIESYGITAEQLTLGYHDVGSFTAKPKAHDGVIDTRQWDGYNPTHGGGALLIP